MAVGAEYQSVRRFSQSGCGDGEYSAPRDVASRRGRSTLRLRRHFDVRGQHLG